MNPVQIFIGLIAVVFVAVVTVLWMVNTVQTRLRNRRWEKDMKKLEIRMNES